MSTMLPGNQLTGFLPKKAFWPYWRKLFFFVGCLVFCIFSSCSTSPKLQYGKKQYTLAIPTRWQYVRLFEADRNIVGFLSDFSLAMGMKFGFSVKFVFVDPDDISSLFENQSIDACFSALPKNPTTERQYLFSQPIFVNGTVVVVSNESPFHTLKDLHGAEIAFDNTQNASITMGADPSWLLKPSGNVLKSLEEVSTRTVDGVILNYMQARLLTKSLFRSRFRILFPPLVSENINLIVARKGAEELITAINQFRELSLKNGEYDELLKYWNIDTPIEESELEKNTTD